MPWCAGTTRHERLVRKHVPDSDPGCALPSTSMPALHRRNVPNCRPMADGGMRKCSAVEDSRGEGLVPRWGRGGAWQNPPCQFAVLSHNSGISTWCAGGSRHQRCYEACPGLRSGIDSQLVTPPVESMPRTPIRGGNLGEGRPACPCHIESLWAVPPQPTVLVRSQFANAQDKLRSNLNSYC